jgi:peptidoglycan/xylan/chitin deacetylase (PgdA/CDA1 family)
LDKLSDAQLKEEIDVSKKRLEALFSVKIETFAFPTGAFDKRTLKELSEAGYLCACTTNRGFSRKLEPLALRRIKVTNNDNDFTLWAKLSGFYNVFKKPKKPY